MIYLLYTIHIVISLFLIAIVLLQQGKGADLSVFGGGATQTAFGARGATTLLHKLTVGAFVGFIVTTLLIGVVQTREGHSNPVAALPEASAAMPPEEVKTPTAAETPAAETPADGTAAAPEAANGAPAAAAEAPAEATTPTGEGGSGN